MRQRVRSVDMSPWVNLGVLSSGPRRQPGQSRADQPIGLGCSSFVYRVRPGDSPFRIAQRFGISVETLLGANPEIADPRSIRPGQLLCVPARPLCPELTDGFIYTVLRGDTLESIAETFDVTPDQILAVNPQIEDPDVLFPGEPLCIPRPAVVAFPCCALLLPTRIESIEVEAVGSAVIRPFGEERFEILFSAAGLPSPGELGTFDAYMGSLRVGDRVESAVLSRGAGFEQPETWSGARRLDVTPAPESEILISPADLESGAVGDAVLRGFVSTCGG